MPTRAVLPRAPLRPIFESDRFQHMDRLEAYFRGKQDDHKRYDWDGNMRGSGLEAYGVNIAPGYYVSHSNRRPSVRYNLAKLIVSRLTQMSLSGRSFPEIVCDGDETAEQSLREWAKIMQLPERIAETRNFGGSQGTGCFSLDVQNGRFVLEVHNPKHVLVTAWADRSVFRVRSAIKAYSYTKQVIDDEAHKLVRKTFWYVRYWDESVMVTYQDVPDEVAQLVDWWTKVEPTEERAHGFGCCPLYWIQNLPDSQEDDGEGDYEGIEDKFDGVNQLLSATSKGTIKNVDPTTVIRSLEDDGERVAKGSEAVIYAEHGAEYLELKGTGIKVSLELLSELRQSVLEEAQVVIPREDKITASAQSAAAMRLLYATMIARCNQLRDQYGRGMINMLTDVLRIAKRVRALPGAPKLDSNGVLVATVQPSLIPNLDPGISDLVSLKWPDYFQPTAIDVKDSVSTAQAASGGKPVISHKTAVEYTSTLFGIQNVDEELAEIEKNADADAERTKQALSDEVTVLNKAKKDEPAE